MLIDQSVSIWCIAVPAALALITAVIAWLADRNRVSTVDTDAETDAGLAGLRSSRGSASLVGLVPRLLLALVWGLAVAAAAGGRAAWDWELLSSEFWYLGLVPVVLFGIAACGPRPATLGRDSWRWLLAGLFAALTAYAVMPSGDGWTDLVGLHRGWMLAVTASCLLNAWAVSRLECAGAERWLLWVVVAGLAGPFVLAASCYGTLAEVCLAAVVTTLVCAIAASLKRLPSLTAVAYPAVALIAAMTATGRFYTYLEFPLWLYGLILFQPTFIAIVDAPLRGRATWLRVIIAALVSAALVGTIAWQVLLAE